jgi:broad specificity phosphatase PhoE
MTRSDTTSKRDTAPTNGTVGTYVRSIALIRHGETAWNAAARLQGTIDVPVSEQGRRALDGVARVVDDLPVDHCVSSDLQRTRETAKLLGFDQPVLDRRWRERDLGAWSGRHKGELQAVAEDQYLAWRRGTFTPPEAETWPSVLTRIQEALDALRDRSGLTIVITHGGPIRAACTVLLGVAPGSLTPVRNGSMTWFDFDAEGHARLRTYNSLL